MVWRARAQMWSCVCEYACVHVLIGGGAPRTKCTHFHVSHTRRNWPRAQGSALEAVDTACIRALDCIGLTRSREEYVAWCAHSFGPAALMRWNTIWAMSVLTPGPSACRGTPARKNNNIVSQGCRGALAFLRRPLSHSSFCLINSDCWTVKLLVDIYPSPPSIHGVRGKRAGARVSIRSGFLCVLQANLVRRRVARVG